MNTYYHIPRSDPWAICQKCDHEFTPTSSARVLCPECVTKRREHRSRLRSTIQERDIDYYSHSRYESMIMAWLKGTADYDNCSDESKEAA